MKGKWRGVLKKQTRKGGQNKAGITKFRALESYTFMAPEFKTDLSLHDSTPTA